MKKKTNENERKTIQQLSREEDIIITKVDKGGAVVIVDVQGYIKEAERQLNNIKNYRKLQEEQQT